MMLRGGDLKPSREEEELSDRLFQVEGHGQNSIPGAGATSAAPRRRPCEVGARSVHPLSDRPRRHGSSCASWQHAKQSTSLCCLGSLRKPKTCAHRIARGSPSPTDETAPSCRP